MSRTSRRCWRSRISRDVDFRCRSVVGLADDQRQCGACASRCIRIATRSRRCAALPSASRPRKPRAWLAGFAGRFRARRRRRSGAAGASEIADKSLPLLYLAGDDRARDMAAELAPAGLRLQTVVVYRAVAAQEFSPEIVAALRDGTIDGALHYSRRSTDIFVGCARAGVEAGGREAAAFLSVAARFGAAFGDRRDPDFHCRAARRAGHAGP